MDQRCGDGGRFEKFSHSIQGFTLFPNFEMLDARLASEQDHSEFVLQEKGHSGGNASPKKRTISFAEDRSLT